MKNKIYLVVLLCRFLNYAVGRKMACVSEFLCNNFELYLKLNLNSFLSVGSSKPFNCKLLNIRKK